MSYNWKTLGLHIPEIMLPAEGIDYSKWAVVACDQYTSDLEYWEDASRIVGDAPSTLKLMLPEVYLDKPSIDKKIEDVHSEMKKYIENGTLKKMPKGCMLVKRIAEGRSRLGVVLSVDLEAYDYSKDSTSMIRATEGTVVERIPPRLKIREGAPLEMPHIIILIDDPDHAVIRPLVTLPSTEIYDFELMKNGGHIYGSFIEEKHLEEMNEAFSTLFDRAKEKYGEDKLILQAMGDGNHSLATAKAAWENIKKTLSPEERETHPARFALCEIENIHDEGIVFEPIHRVLFAKNGNSADNITEELLSVLNKQNGKAYISMNPVELPGDTFVIPCISGGVEAKLIIENPSHKLEVGSLQNALDIIVKELKIADIDYIHGEGETRKLAEDANNIGFLLPAMDKFKLFPAIAEEGALPRKTFSMGEANEKRFYIETKSITL